MIHELGKANGKKSSHLYQPTAAEAMVNLSADPFVPYVCELPYLNADVTSLIVVIAVFCVDVIPSFSLCCFFVAHGSPKMSNVVIFLQFSVALGLDGFPDTKAITSSFYWYCQ